MDLHRRKHSAGTRWCSGWWHGVMTGGLVSAGWVYRGLPGQAGAGSGGIHGRPTIASWRTVIMFRPCLVAVDKTPRMV